MATYTAVADINGDFNIPFGTTYTGGQKVTVTADKDGASKTIEIFAPSSVIGGGVIQFSGNMADFPRNIGRMILSSDISGAINTYAMHSGNNASMYAYAAGLEILGAVTSIGNFSFYAWTRSTSLSLPPTLKTIGLSAFYNWTSLSSLNLPDSVESIGSNAFENCGASTLHLPVNVNFTDIPLSCFNGAKFTQVLVPNNVKVIKGNALRAMTLCTKITIGSGVTTFEAAAMIGNTACTELIMLPTTPPTLPNATTIGLATGAVIKVPSASLSAYQTAQYWSALASQMVGV